MQIYFIAATVKSKSATKYLEQLILFKLAVVEAIGVKSVAFECKAEDLHLIEQSITNYFHTNVSSNIMIIRLYGV